MELGGVCLVRGMLVRIKYTINYPLNTGEKGKWLEACDTGIKMKRCLCGQLSILFHDVCQTTFTEDGDLVQPIGGFLVWFAPSEFFTG